MDLPFFEDLREYATEYEFSSGEEVDAVGIYLRKYNRLPRSENQWGIVYDTEIFAYAPDDGLCHWVDQLGMSHPEVELWMKVCFHSFEEAYDLLASIDLADIKYDGIPDKYQGFKPITLDVLQGLSYQ